MNYKPYKPFNFSKWELKEATLDSKGQKTLKQMEKELEKYLTEKGVKDGASVKISIDSIDKSNGEVNYIFMFAESLPINYEVKLAYSVESQSYEVTEEKMYSKGNTFIEEMDIADMYIIKHTDINELVDVVSESMRVISENLMKEDELDNEMVTQAPDNQTEQPSKEEAVVEEQPENEAPVEEEKPVQ